MARGKYVNPTERGQVKILRREGLSFSQIAGRLSLSKTAVIQAMKHVETYNTTADKKRVKYKRKTKPHLDRVIHRISEADRHKTAVDIHTEMSNHPDFNISVRTVQRRLGEYGLQGRVARKKPYISPKNRLARLEFARRHIHWTPEQWNKVLFSDESKFNRLGSDGKAYVRRRPGEEFRRPSFTTGTVKGGGGSLLFWGAMGRRGPGPIHVINGIMNAPMYVEIMNDIMLPYARREMGRGWILQQDNDPKHTSKVAKEWFSSKRVDVMKWPAQSPDLNPIETLWNDVNAAVKKEKPKNLGELEAVVKTMWPQISQERCARLIDSMPRRLAEVIKNHGYSTSY
jgi:transposase